MTRDELGSDGHIPKEGKEALSRLIKFKEMLVTLIEFNRNPLPNICSTAVYVTCWLFLIMGAIAAQPCNDSHHGHWWILEDLPFYECMVFAIIFSWLKMAEVCKSPFDGYKYYDIDLIQELDVNIWIAS